LAFAAREGERVPGDERWLGDIVISIPTTQRQAAERGRSFSEELKSLIVHGLLHLLGYDHERSPAEARKMRRKERWLLEALDS
jgi:rRNA maturation RNase YbeY